MGKVVFNSGLNVSGRVDGWVYRQVKGQVVVARQPRRKAGTVRPSAAQSAQQERFRAANAYARRILADPCRRRAYERLAQQLDRRADRLVVSDYLTPPEIEQIDVSNYRGKIGGTIRVLAFDDVEVVSVTVGIHTTGGEGLEQGAATKDHGVWIYTATVAPASGETVTISATAQDRAENTTTRTISYP